MGVALYIQWAVFYQSWLNPQPPWPGILMEEGFRGSSGGKAVVGGLWSYTGLRSLWGMWLTLRRRSRGPASAARRVSA